MPAARSEELVPVQAAICETRMLMLAGTNLGGSSLMCQDLAFFFGLVIHDKLPTVLRINSWSVGSTRYLSLSLSLSLSHSVIYALNIALICLLSVASPNQLWRKVLQLCSIHLTPGFCDCEFSLDETSCSGKDFLKCLSQFIWKLLHLFYLEVHVAFSGASLDVL